MTSRHESSDPLTLLQLPSHNPWWEESVEPTTPSRANFYWQFETIRDNVVSIIPGPVGTGKTRLLQTFATQLIAGDHVDDARQICYVPCGDPVAQACKLPDVLDRFQRYTVPGNENDTHYVLLDDLHMINGWRSQLTTVVENWNPSPTGGAYHFVATLPGQWLLDADSGGEPLSTSETPQIEGAHLTQKFRDTVLAHANSSETGDPGTAGELQKTVASAEYPQDQQSEPRYKSIRWQLYEGIQGEQSPDDVVSAFEPLHDVLLQHQEVIESAVDTYLTSGGFDLPDQHWERTDGVPSVSTPSVLSHIESAIRTTLFEEIPRLADLEAALDRIERPSELLTLCTLIARRSGDSVNYRWLADTIGCDTRTLKSPYLSTLQRFDLLHRAEQYDLQRHRSIDLFFRSPGYVNALQPGSRVSTANREKLVRHTVADHTIRRFQSPLYFWNSGSEHLDFVTEYEGCRFPIMLEPSDPTALVEEFASLDPSHRDNDPINLAVALRDGLTTPRVLGDRVIELPTWCYLLIC